MGKRMSYYREVTTCKERRERREREKKGGKKGRKEKGGAKESAGEDAPRRVERKPAITITLRVGVRPTQIRAVPPLLPPLNSIPRHAFLLSYTSKMTRRGVMKPRVASSLFLSFFLSLSLSVHLRLVLYIFLFCPAHCFRTKGFARKRRETRIRRCFITVIPSS